MDLNNRQQRRAHALASQIYHAGYFVPCNCGLSGCMFRRTPRSIANKIIRGQWQTLKLNDDIINAAMRMVSIIDD
jgi:hypothetical protein